MANYQEKVAKTIISTIEEKLDEEISMLDQLDASGLDKLREKRLQELKEAAQLKNSLINLGHGEYSELEEKDFFNACKKSTKVVVHFYKNDTPRCKIFDHHLKILAPKYFKTRFLKIDAERAPFLADRLKIKVIPTIVIVLDGKVKDYLIGFSDLGSRDDFKTELLEWRLAVSHAIDDYDGDISQPPGDNNKRPPLVNRLPKRAIKEKDNSSSEDSD